MNRYKDVESLYPRWMQRWNAWTKHADAALISFVAEFGDLLGEALRDIGHRVDRLIFAAAKDDLSRQRATSGTPEYEYWCRRLEAEKDESTVSDRW